MSFCRCLNPRSVRNRYTGEFVTVSCGECDACRNSRVFRWVTRLDIEASCHKYVLFATLTFDEQHVAQMMLLDANDYCKFGIDTDKFVKDEISYVLSDGRFVRSSEIQSGLSGRDIRFCKSSKFLNVLDRRDFQLFIKRLRYYFNECEEGALLRYFIGAEYGPETLRPHAHMLLFFDSDKCAEQIQVLLSKSWQNGVVYDPHFVSGSAASYCASYINSVSLLPKIYLHKSIRPFSMFSKRPSIGSLFKDDSELREAFDRGDSSFTWYNSSANKFENVPFWRSLVSRLYPRCQYFGSLAHSDRITLYRLIQEFPSHLSCREVAERIFCEYVDNGRDTFLSRYFTRLVKGLDGFVSPDTVLQFEPVAGYLDDTLPFPYPDTFKSVCVLRGYLYTSLPCGCRRLSYLRNPNPLVSFVSVVRRVQYQSQIFGITIDEYVSKIELWQEKLERQRYADYVHFQDDYFKHHPLWHLVYFDYSFYDLIGSFGFFHQYDQLSDGYRNFLMFLFDGAVPLKNFEGDYYVDIPSYQSMPFYIGFRVSSNALSSKLVKQRHNNDYVSRSKSKFKNIVDYYSLN